MAKDVQNNNSKPPKDDHFINLKFIVNSEPTEVKINLNAPLKAAVEKALDQTGNTTRPITDWNVKYNNQILDINKKVEEFHFPAGAEIFLSLNAGEGGNCVRRK